MEKLFVIFRKPLRRALIPLIVIGCALCAGESAAQTSDRVLAQSLFDEARRLMDAGEHAAACPKLAESQKLDPAGGTILNLGLCFEAVGKTASAWAVLEDALAYARRDGHAQREKIARSHLETIRPILSHLTIEVAPDADVPGVKVTLDGRDLPRAAWGTGFPVDPGAHRIEATAPGRVSFARDLEIGSKADRQTVDVPPWQQAGSAPIAAPTATSETAPATGDPAADEGESGSNATLGYIVGGTGLVLVGVGSYFGVKAISSWSDRNDHCQDGRCDETAKNLGDDANTQGNIANVTIGLGLVGVAVGTYLVLSGSDEGDQRASSRGVQWSPTAAKNSVGMTVGGAF